MVLVVLAAVLVGAAIPALVQLRATLRVMESTLQRSGARLDQALDATRAAAGRIDAVVARLEEGGRLERLADGVAAAGRVTSQLRDSLRIASALGAALGPAVAAAVHAFRNDRAPAPPAEPPAAGGNSGAAPTEQRKQAMP
jgi:hypothetical protein